MSVITNRVYFLLKDPRWSFIWWHIDWIDAVQDMMARYGRTDPGSPAIRIHDVTDIIFDGTNSHGYLEIEENIGYIDHWYFGLPNSGRNYCAEVGIKRGRGWFPVSRSNTLFVPRVGPSASLEESWSTIEMT